MFSHVMVGSNDIERSKTFYDALFAAVGGKPGRVDPKGRLSYLHKGAAFMVSKPIDGAPACHANGGTIGFSLEGPSRSRPGTRPASRTAAPLARTRPAPARAASGRSTLPTCVTRTGTSSARCTDARGEEGASELNTRPKCQSSGLDLADEARASNLITCNRSDIDNRGTQRLQLL
jgi:hypothetical protein